MLFRKVEGPVAEVEGGEDDGEDDPGDDVDPLRPEEERE